MRSTRTLIVATAIGLGTPAAGETCTIAAPVSHEQVVPVPTSSFGHGRCVT